MFNWKLIVNMAASDPAFPIIITKIYEETNTTTQPWKYTLEQLWQWQSIKNFLISSYSFILCSFHTLVTDLISKLTWRTSSCSWDRPESTPCRSARWPPPRRTPSCRSAWPRPPAASRRRRRTGSCYTAAAGTCRTRWSGKPGKGYSIVYMLPKHGE